MESAWSNVTSGVPQGSVIGPILFLLFVSDITDEVHSDMILFADDTKLYRRIISDEDGHILQRDIDVLHASWSQIWLIEFNIGKCKSLHYGYGNSMREYTIDNEILQSTDEEKDLGVLMSASLKPSSQCAAAASKAMSALYRSRRTFKYINEESFKIFTKLTYDPILNFVYMLGAHTCQKISK